MWTLEVEALSSTSKREVTMFSEELPDLLSWTLYLCAEGESLRMLDETAFDESLGVNRDPGMAYDGSAMPEKAGYNLNLAYGSESPVDALPSAR